jgi:molybdenum cofactor synthesis domain-containing protein
MPSAIKRRRPSGRPAPRVRPARAGAARIELVAVGRELVRGRVHETNTTALARYFSDRGALVQRITIIDGRAEVIGRCLREALERNPNLVVTTGGLGPGSDDETLVAVAEVLGRPLAVHAEAKELVEAAYTSLQKRRLGRGGLTAARQKLYSLPLGAVPVPNPAGVAPGVICRLAGGSAILCLPGIPEEMRAVLETGLPRLQELVPQFQVAEREIEAPTADESALRPILDRLATEHPGVWVHSHPVTSRRSGSKIRIRLEASAASLPEANAALDRAVKRLLALAAGSP